MKWFILALACLFAIPSLVLAAEPVSDPLEIAIANQWQAIQTVQQNLIDALAKIIEAWRKDRTSLSAERATSTVEHQYWESYITGVHAEHNAEHKYWENYLAGINETWRKDQAALSAEHQYWEGYVVGVDAEHQYWEKYIK